MGLVETISAVGHANVRGTHESTFELTTDDYLTPAGDCIVGISANRAPADFAPAFVDRCRRDEASITITLATDEHEAVVQASGSADLTFASDRSAVVRTSTYVDDRTVAVTASHAAADIDRDLVGALPAGGPLEVTLEVELA